MGSSLCKAKQQNNNQIVFTKRPNPDSCLKCFDGTNKVQQKKGNITPIQFSDIPSLNNSPIKQIQNEEVVQKNQVSSNSSLNHKNNNQQTANIEYYRQHKMVPTTARTQAKYLQNSPIERRNIQLKIVQSSKPIYVPNSVIRLLIKPQVLKQSKKTIRNFQYYISDTPTNLGKDHNWILNSKGFYTCKYSEKACLALTDTQLFKGNLNQNYKTQGQGILINETGSYNGFFENGLANGKGSFTSIKGEKYEGQWRDGQLQKGFIQTGKYYYQGQLKNNVPHGYGNLNIKSKNIIYKGPFVNGIFQGQNGQYNCSQYIYKGEFKNGKKNGKGKLTMKQRSATKQNPNIKFRPQKIFEGDFIDDVICVQRKNQKKK